MEGSFSHLTFGQLEKGEERMKKLAAGLLLGAVLLGTLAQSVQAKGVGPEQHTDDQPS